MKFIKSTLGIKSTILLLTFSIISFIAKAQITFTILNQQQITVCVQDTAFDLNTYANLKGGTFWEIANGDTKIIESQSFFNATTSGQGTFFVSAGVPIGLAWQYDTLTVNVVQCETTGNTKIQSPGTKLIYPNPTSGLLFLDVGRLQTNFVNVHDLSGKIVKTISIKQLSDKVTSLNITELNRGLYFFTTESGLFLAKVFKQ